MLQDSFPIDRRESSWKRHLWRCIVGNLGLGSIRPHADIHAPNEEDGPNKISPPSSDFRTAGFQVKTLDGSDELEDEVVQLSNDLGQPENRWRGYWDFGLLYNSNITLTPISRELFPTEDAGFQAIFGPDTEWSMI